MCALHECIEIAYNIYATAANLDIQMVFFVPLSSRNQGKSTDSFLLGLLKRSWTADEVSQNLRISAGSS